MLDRRSDFQFAFMFYRELDNRRDNRSLLRARGIGVREHRVIAASLVVPADLLNLVAAALVGQFPSFLAILAFALLIANIRSTWITARWKQEGNPDDLPLRFNETWRDKLVDQMPAIVWPKTKMVFYIVVVLYMGLLALGTAVILTRATSVQHY